MLDKVKCLDALLGVGNKLKSIGFQNDKTLSLLLKWLPCWVVHVEREKNFSPKALRLHKRGEIILVDFGFNIGAELGGKHFSVVLEKNNVKENPMIVVMPISTFRGKPLHEGDVHLGQGIIPRYPI